MSKNTPEEGLLSGSSRPKDPKEGICGKLISAFAYFYHNAVKLTLTDT
jgi:hypothetical protein